MTQETLEEAAENYGWRIKTNSFSDRVKANELAESAKQDFIEGAKWQQERMYSEEDMIEFGFSTYCYISELMGVPFNLISENKLHAMYNFEQFKKK